MARPALGAALDMGKEYLNMSRGGREMPQQEPREAIVLEPRAAGPTPQATGALKSRGEGLH